MEKIALMKYYTLAFVLGFLLFTFVVASFLEGINKLAFYTGIIVIVLSIFGWVSVKKNY